LAAGQYPPQITNTKPGRRPEASGFVVSGDIGGPYAHVLQVRVKPGMGELPVSPPVQRGKFLGGTNRSQDNDGAIDRMHFPRQGIVSYGVWCFTLRGDGNLDELADSVDELVPTLGIHYSVSLI
jgi:hypothetical protein